MAGMCRMAGCNQLTQQWSSSAHTTAGAKGVTCRAKQMGLPILPAKEQDELLESTAEDTTIYSVPLLLAFLSCHTAEVLSTAEYHCTWPGICRLIAWG
jgi:hypothetical protein